MRNMMMRKKINNCVIMVIILVPTNTVGVIVKKFSTTFKKTSPTPFKSGDS